MKFTTELRAILKKQKQNKDFAYQAGFNDALELLQDIEDNNTPLSPEDDLLSAMKNLAKEISEPADLTTIPKIQVSDVPHEISEHDFELGEETKTPKVTQEVVADIAQNVTQEPTQELAQNMTQKPTQAPRVAERTPIKMTVNRELDRAAQLAAIKAQNLAESEEEDDDDLDY